MIEFKADQLLQMALKLAEQEKYDDALGLLGKLRASPEVDQAGFSIHYSLGKSLVASGECGRAREAFAYCASRQHDPTVQSLSQERNRLLGAILAGNTEPVTAFRGLAARVAIAHATTLKSGALQPYVWFVGAPAAYRSGYDPERRDDLSRLLRMAKHQVSPETIAPLGKILADYLFTGTPLLKRVDYLVPVPTDPTRWNERGYSIPLALAASVSESCAVPLHDEVVETTDSVPELRSVPRWYRKYLVEGAYQVTGKLPWVTGRSLLLLDDVVTSGSTLSSIARRLLECGAKEVCAVALAHTEWSR